MTFRLVWENVRYRPVRTLLSVLLIAVPVTLILMLIGLSRGMLEDRSNRSRGAGADLIFRSPSSSVIGFSAAALPEKFLEVLGREPHVADAIGVVSEPIGGGIESITGIDLASFNRMSGGFVFVEGHTLEKPDDILVDRYYADQSHVHAGDTIKILNVDWHVAGIVEPGKLSHLFVHLPVLQRMVGATGKLGVIYLKVDDPARIDAVEDALKKKFDTYPVISMKELESLYSVDNIPVLKSFINVVLGIGLVVGFAVVSFRCIWRCCRGPARLGF